MSAETIVRELAPIDPPEIDTRIASFVGGTFDEDVAWWLGMANMVASDPVGQALYLAHVADETTRFRQIKDWAYRVAVEFVGSKGGKQRKRSLVESYRVDWGHSAARDGAAIAMWGAEGVPGLVVRAEQFKCGKQAYGRVRDAVQNRATDLIGDYRLSLKWARGDLYSSDHVERWEAITGRTWDHSRGRV